MKAFLAWSSIPWRGISRRETDSKLDNGHDDNDKDSETVCRGKRWMGGVIGTNERVVYGKSIQKAFLQWPVIPFGGLPW